MDQLLRLLMNISTVLLILIGLKGILGFRWPWEYINVKKNNLRSLLEGTVKGAISKEEYQALLDALDQI